MNAHDTREFLTKKLLAIKAQRKAGDLEELALVIGMSRRGSLELAHSMADGKSLTYALEKDLSKTFLELAVMCKAVICCKSAAANQVHV